jgi:hypothetical protein
MRRDEFSGCLAPLIERFGDGRFPEVLIDSLYKKFGLEKQEVFAQACDYLLCESRSSPVLSDFNNALRLVKPPVSAAEKFKDTKFCTWCDQSGVVWSYTREAKKTRIFFRCQCWRGMSSLFGAEVWNSGKHFEKYTLETYLDEAKDRPEERDLVFIQKTPEEINQLLSGISFQMPYSSQSIEQDIDLPF